MTANYSNSLYKDYEKVCNKLDAVLSELTEIRKEHKKEKQELMKKIDELTKLVNNQQKLIEEKDKEILRLKSKNDRDSSNSSKPSSTNGYKKVITNRREKSDKKQGGQKGHKPHSLNNKLEQFINSGNVKDEIIEVNKNEFNKNKRYIEKVVIDIIITKSVKRYRYYPDENGKYNIPKCHNQNVQYGSTIKSVCVDLMNNLYNSTDGVTRFIEDITNGGMTISKGTLILWNNELSSKLEPEINNIELELKSSYYLNHDESNQKINGDNYNTLCACNDMYTRLWTNKRKSKKALEEIGFLTDYCGIIVKDGTELYNSFGIGHAQCLSHILRYLKPYYKDIKHKAPKKMSDFLSNCNTLRNQMIKENNNSFSKDKYQELIEEYDTIIDEWEVELRNDKDNYLFNDEYCLWRRMKYDNKNMDKEYRGDRDEILYFLKDFKVPSTNNAAEVAQRPGKVKQKIGKFRSIDGSENYSRIRSCISTYKKNDINVFNSLISAFNDNIVIV